jgi:phage tail sheath protein FI
MERMVSPGIFTRENDLSFLPQGIAEIGAAFIGPTAKGPAFRPVIVESPEDFQRTFGGATPDFYTPTAVQTYLSEAASATVVRVLGLNGYSPTVNNSLVLRFGSQTLAVLHPSQVGVTLTSGSITGTPLSFALSLSGSSGLKTYGSMSINPTSPNYFASVLGTSADAVADGFVYAVYPNALNAVPGALVGSGSLSLIDATTELNFSGSVNGAYSNARTPWIRSQRIGSEPYQLFRFWTLSDGTAANTDVKVSIGNIRPAVLATDYGTFSVIVRAMGDTDSKISVLEQYDNLTLDQNSVNYVARRIGTSRTVIDANNDIYLDGEWPNNSQYLYLEVADGLDGAPLSALPYGFAALSPTLNAANVPAPSYVTTRYTLPQNSTVPIVNTRLYYGLNLDDATTASYMKALPSGSVGQVGVTASGVGDVGFDLLETLAAQDLIDISANNGVTFRRYTVGFQGGFDGQNPAVVRNTSALLVSTNTQGYDLSDSTKSGAVAYKRAIDALANADAWDINLVVLPGVVYSQHSYVVSEAISMAEGRGDCFVVIDGDVLGATADSAVNAVQDLDTSYAGTYHPWMKVRDAATNKLVWVPPSVLIPSVYAFNDRVGAEWFAPAGLNRGGISQALQVRTRLDKGNRDVLYEGRVNPIALFPATGIAVWGQKTLQRQASALDRINVRRLMIAVKKFIASASRYLVFEQNVDATRNRFLNIVNPYLASVQERNGLFAFRVEMSSENNTPDLIDRNVLVGQIYLQPTRSAEFISLEFNILPTGATFTA